MQRIAFENRCLTGIRSLNSRVTQGGFRPDTDRTAGTFEGIARSFSVLIKKLREMKLALLFLIAAFLGMQTSGLAQTVTFSGKAVPLKQVFAAVKKQTGYVVFGKDELLKESRPVTIAVTNMPLTEFLMRVMQDQPLNFRIDGKNIILARKPLASQRAARQTPGDAYEMRNTFSVIGHVYNDDGKPVGGASVTVKGTARTRLTNMDGEVLNEGIRGSVVFVITSIGYETREVSLKAGETQFTVYLKIKVNELGGVEVRNGMFTRRKEDFTGATSSYTGDQLKAIGNKNILESLKTLDPSFIQITNNLQGSNPNTMPTFEIRGRTSISTTDLNNQFNADPNQPLFILDGFESTLQTIYDLDMNRVASVTILKDAASTALYGAKASNGVVVVETKRPVPGELRVSYTADLSMDLPDLSSYNLMDGAEKLQFEKLSGIYTQPNSQWLSDAQYNQRLATVQSGVNTYWLSEPVHMGFTNRHSLQLSGGNNELLFNAGASYSNQNGVMKGSGRQNWSGNFNLTYRKGKLNITDMLTVSGNKAIASPYGSFSDFAQANPYYKKRNADGSIPKFLDPTDTSMYNPLYNASLYSINKTPSFTFTNNLQAIVTLTRSLRLQGGLQLGKGNSTATVFIPPDNTSFESTDVQQKGSYSNTHTENTSFNGNLMVTWAKVIGRNQFNANARAEMQQTSSEATGYTAVGFPFGTDGNPSFSFQYTPFSRPSASTLASHSVGFLGSVNYVFDQRFLLDATYRLDGASVFGSNRLFKPFASGGLGWNLHREAFLRSVRWINLLKIRGNIGFTGNENLGQFTSVSTYSFQQGQSNFGQGLNMLSLGNPNLEWQKTLQKSYGVDFSFFSNRISGNVDYFTKYTNPLAIGTSGTLPSSAGVNSNYVINVGHLDTKGWEFNLRLSPIYDLKKRIIWTIGITGSAYKSTYGGLGNTLTALNMKGDSLSGVGGANAANGLNRYNDGYSPDDIWAVVSRGIDPATGKEIFQKKDGSFTFDYDPNDIVRVGNSRPKIEGVINTTFTYKNFTLGAAIRYSRGGYLLNGALYTKVENISYNQVRYNQDKRALYERWQKPGDVSQFKSISINTSTPMSSRFVEKDNYFDGESFSLGYRVSNGWIRQLSMQSLSFNFYLNDIFWMESVKTERGTDYPYARTASLSMSAFF